MHGGGLVGVDLDVAHLGEGGTEGLLRGSAGSRRVARGTHDAEGAGGGAEATGTEGEGHGCRRGGEGGGGWEKCGRNNNLRAASCAADGSTEQGRRGLPSGGDGHVALFVSCISSTLSRNVGQ